MYLHNKFPMKNLIFGNSFMIIELINAAGLTKKYVFYEVQPDR